MYERNREAYKKKMKFWEKWICECYDVASNESDDLSNQNAAMFISIDGKFGPIVANKIPDKVNKTNERIATRPLKYDFIEHAERGAIYAAARSGLCTNEGTLVVPWHSCADCARAIVLAGIRLVVGHKQRVDLTSHGRDKVVDVVSDRWVNPISSGDAILREAGVELLYLDFEAKKKILINEQLLDV